MPTGSWAANGTSRTRPTLDLHIRHTPIPVVHTMPPTVRPGCDVHTDTCGLVLSTSEDRQYPARCRISDRRLNNFESRWTGIIHMGDFQERIQTVRCEHPEAEVWRHLGLLATPSYAETALRKLFKDSLGSRLMADKLDGFAKCMLQAREYFYASRSVTAATAPTLCYYGMVSLCAAVAIFKSRDLTLRSTPKAHGLTPEDLTPCTNVLDAACRVDSSGMFPLIGTLNVADYCTYERWLPVSDDYIPVGPAHFAVAVRHGDSRVTEVTAKRLVLSDLLSRLPDIGFEAWTHPETSLAVLDCTVSVERMNDREVTSARLRASCEDSGQVERLTQMMSTSYPSWQQAAVGQEVYEYEIKNVANPFADPCPPLRDSVSGKTFIALPGSRGTPVMPEMCDWLGAGFLTGTLARYYPQVWLGKPRARPETALLTERFLEAAPRRFPNLVLNALYGRLFRFIT